MENKKLIVLFVVIMASLTQAALVLYTPAFVSIAEFFHVSDAMIETTLTVYLLGFGISQFFYGPASDRIGRKKPLLIGMFLLSLGCFFSIISESYTLFLWSRIIQGVGAGSCMALSRSILRDCFEGQEYVRIVSYLSSGFALGLGLTPVIGGYLIAYFPWQAEFVFLLCVSLLLLLCFLFLLPETMTITAPVSKLGDFSISIVRLFFKTLKNKNFIGYLVGGIMAYSILIAYNTMGPFLIQKTLGHSSQFYGWLTLFMSVAYYIGTAVNRKLVIPYGIHFMMKSGLILILVSGLFMLICQFVFKFEASFYIILPLLIATCGQALIWSNCIAAALEDLSAVSGTASAFFSSVQMLLSALISAIIAVLPSNQPIVLSLVIIVLGLISWSSLHWVAFRSR